MWWRQRQDDFPRLSRMAIDFLTIPGKLSLLDNHFVAKIFLASSVAVERIFSKGRIVLSHLRNKLEAQTTRAILCVGEWSVLDMVKREDLQAAAKLPEIEEDVEELMEDWAKITL